MVFKSGNWLDCFFLLVDWRKFHVNVWGGIAASILQLIHDTELASLGNYQFNDVGIWVLKSSFFLTFGIVFTMGVIFFQFIPKNMKLKIIHVIVFTAGLLIFEYIMVSNGKLKHIHYSYWLSLADNLLVLSALSWIKSFVLFIYNILGRKLRKC